MRSARLLALALALTTPALLAQDLPSSLGTVQGTLLAADNKQPILDASVWLEPVASGNAVQPARAADTGYVARDTETTKPAAAKTDPAGRFLLPRIKPGDYYVVFSAQGYVSDRDFVPPAGALSSAKPLPDFVQQVTVTPGKTADVSLLLQHGGAIEGTVRYANGNPGYSEQSAGSPAGLAVNVGVRRPDGTFVPVAGSAHTDPQGHFRIPDLPAGSYLVFASPTGDTTGTATSQRPSGNPAVFYGDATSPRGAKVADVHGTQTTTGIDINLPSPASPGGNR